jgi:hypothetical protein
VSDFSLLIQGDRVHLTRAQLEAITNFATESGGIVEVSSAGFGTVRVVDSGGQELLYRPDGHIDPPS